MNIINLILVAIYYLLGSAMIKMARADDLTICTLFKFVILNSIIVGFLVAIEIKI